MERKIGIGITTHNRYSIFSKSFQEITRLTPNATIVVVDDASNSAVPEATYRFDENVGIAKAKNKCLELLYKSGCTDIFLFDDDTYPLKKNWFVPYIESDEPHLMYIFKDFATGRRINDTVVVYRDSKKVAYSHPRGCMLYLTREVLDKVGGMDERFKKWGFEHAEFSDRIFNAGLTTFRYMDVVGSKGLFWSNDEQTENRGSTVLGSERAECIKRNKSLYQNLKHSDKYVPFYNDKAILSAYFTSITDPQRNIKWETDITKLIPLIKSVKETPLYIFHDCFEGEEVEFESDKVHFVKVETSINPVFQKWVTIREFLLKNPWLRMAFCVDSTDVEILREPEWESINTLVTGDEAQVLGCPWMKKYYRHLEIIQLIKEKANIPLLNSGIVGGSREILVKFIGQMLSYYQEGIHERELKGGPDFGPFNMGLFNFVARRHWDNIFHGRIVNTRFKKNEYNNISWFKHK